MNRNGCDRRKIRALNDPCVIGSPKTEPRRKTYLVGKRSVVGPVVGGYEVHKKK